MFQKLFLSMLVKFVEENGAELLQWILDMIKEKTDPDTFGAAGPCPDGCDCTEDEAASIREDIEQLLAA